MTSPRRLDEVRRLLDATPPSSSALPTLRAPSPAPEPPVASAPPAPPAPPAAAAGPVQGAVPSRLAQPVGWLAGLLAVAGIIHLVLLPGHLEEARGIGLYFCLVGGAQVIWALLFVLGPTRRLAWLGVVALAVQPLTVYALTRVARPPFGDHAEGVDFIGAVTGALELAVLVPAVLYLARTRPGEATAARAVALPLAVALAAGILVGAAVYGAGLVAEDLVPWLDEPEAPHSHAAAGEAAGLGVPSPVAGAGAHAHAHAGHGVA